MSKKIVFMGTPDFAVESLKQLIESGIEVAAVVTSPDRKSGRGQQINQSAVKQFALKHNLRVLQPEKLKSEEFHSALTKLQADLFVVVAFRMLPEVVWDMPNLGTINLHGSLLPQYRGAAPINWAVINGEKETGATTFFIEKEIDTGKIIDSVKIPIEITDNAGIVHDKLMVDGAKLLATTVHKIFDGTVESKNQLDIADGMVLKHAPKIFKADCKLDWNNTTETLYNKIRGLSPYPAAWTKIKNEKDKIKSLKIFTTKFEVNNQNNSAQIKVNEFGVFFGTNNGWLKIEELQLEGKKRMPTKQFIQGFDFNKHTIVMD